LEGLRASKNPLFRQLWAVGYPNALEAYILLPERPNDCNKLWRCTLHET